MLEWIQKFFGLKDPVGECAWCHVRQDKANMIRKHSSWFCNENHARKWDERTWNELL